MQASDKASVARKTERRTVKRQKSFLQGRILFNHRQSSVDCTIRDISERGARLKLSDAITTPEAIELYIPNKDEIYRARVIWRHYSEMGILFNVYEGVGQSPESVETDDLAGRVRKLEQDIAKLRRIVIELRAELRNSED